MLTGDYDEFFNHYQPFVASFVARRVERDVVDDLVAEVFAVAWRRRDEVPDDALPWLYRTARNVVGNRYRSKTRLEALKTKMQAIPRESPEDPAQVASQREAVLEAFGDLADDDRELLLLVAWEGLTMSEIAEVLDVSPGAASVRLHRARQRLEQALRSDEPAPKGDR